MAPRGIAIVTAALLAFSLGALGADSNQIDVTSYPPALRERYAVFAVKCSKCHSLARPINSRLGGDDWKAYIKKMIRRPGSGINEESGRKIYEFLKYYTAVKRGELEPTPDGGLL